MWESWRGQQGPSLIMAHHQSNSSHRNKALGCNSFYKVVDVLTTRHTQSLQESLSKPSSLHTAINLQIRYSQLSAICNKLLVNNGNFLHQNAFHPFLLMCNHSMCKHQTHHFFFKRSRMFLQMCPRKALNDSSKQRVLHIWATAEVCLSCTWSYIWQALSGARKGWHCPG